MAEIGKRPKRVDEFTGEELAGISREQRPSLVTGTRLSGAEESQRGAGIRQREFEKEAEVITANLQEESARKERTKQQKRGRASTIVGGRKGDTSDLSLSRRTLLGV